jgi:hypothetical protein
MTYAYSAQATKDWQYDYKNQTDKITGTLSFDRGYAKFGYLYGDARTGATVDFHLEISLGGKPFVIDQPIIFDQPLKWNTRVYNQSSAGIYYDVELVPYLRKVKFQVLDERDASGQIKRDAYVGTRIEKAVRVKITARNSLTGKVETNPFQRVKLKVLPLFLVNDQAKAAIEFPGQLTYQTVTRNEALPEYWKEIINDPDAEVDPEEQAYWESAGMVTEDDVYLSRLLNVKGIIEQIIPFNWGLDPTYWLSYRQIPTEYLNATPRLQLDFDLINGQGEAIFLPNSKYGDKDVLRSYMVGQGLDETAVEQELTNAEINEQLKDFVWPKVIITVQPENYYIAGYQSCGQTAGLTKADDFPLPAEANKYEPYTSKSFRAQESIQCPARNDSSDSFLYRDWQKNSQLADKLYTVVPLTAELMSQPDEQTPTAVPLYRFILWLFVSLQLLHLILGLIVITRLAKKRPQSGK